jgi:hypothetical protein
MATNMIEAAIGANTYPNGDSIIEAMKTDDGKVVPMVKSVFSLNSKRILSFSE